MQSCRIRILGFLCFINSDFGKDILKIYYFRNYYAKKKKIPSIGWKYTIKCLCKIVIRLKIKERIRKNENKGKKLIKPN